MPSGVACDHHTHVVPEPRLVSAQKHHEILRSDFWIAPLMFQLINYVAAFLWRDDNLSFMFLYYIVKYYYAR